MIIRKPWEPKWLSWILVIAWMAYIIYTITDYKDIRTKVDDDFGKQFVKWFVIGLASAGVIGGVVVMMLNRARYRIWNYIALALLLFLYVKSVYYIYTSPYHSRWEAMHFVQYGVLGVLMFRALAHSFRDWAVFFIALGITVTFGSIDESIQWGHPDRYWDFTDLVLNGYSASLSLLIIWLGLNPAYLSAKWSGKSIRVFTTVLVIFLLYLGLCYSNTAKWSPFWEKNFPSVAKGAENDGPMAEYGFLYEYTVDDPRYMPETTEHIVPAEKVRSKGPYVIQFKSRLNPDALKKADGTRAEEAARVMPLGNQAHMLNLEAYKKFLVDYSPAGDPWLHELRVHLYSRDKNEQRVREQIEAPKPDFPGKVTKMVFENKLLFDKYPEYMKLHGYEPDQIFLAQQLDHLIPGPYLSGVSKHLITRVSLTRIWIMLGVLIVLSLFVNVRFGGRGGAADEA
jgi:VanZ family protein